MKKEVKLAHINIVAKDWKKLAQFYLDVFECEPVYPEKDLHGNWIDKLTGIPDVKIKGILLKLPGCDEGVGLEIFEFNEMPKKNQDPSNNDQGFAHIAFLVSDMDNTIKKIIAYGGKEYGEITKKKTVSMKP
ncbi:MAG TPA: hypothetical protein PKN48_02110 [Bacteroidales bacterium]|nr:hypothetical protein [Bacteroidales bacterium]